MVPRSSVNRQCAPYKPHVRIIDADAGLYTVQSERYTHLLYAVNVVAGTCECEAGRNGFKNCRRLGGVCKHLHICRQYHAYRRHYLGATQPTAARRDAVADLLACYPAA